MPVIKRSNSKFWYVQFQLNHRTILRSTQTTDRKTAERMEAKLRSEAYDELVMGKKKPLTLEAALKLYLRAREGTPNHRNLVSHQRTILSAMKGSMPISALNNSDLEEFKRNRFKAGYGPQTVKHGLNAIMGAIRLARRHGYDAPELYAPTVKMGVSMTRYLSVEEERRLLAELDPGRCANGLAPLETRSAKTIRAMQDNYDLVILLLDTGARYSEIANIPWDNINLADQTMRLWRSKVQNESTLFMSNRIVAVLERRALSRQGRFVFSNGTNGPRGYKVIALRKALDRAGLTDCTIHTLRHTHASRLIQHGMSVYEVKSVLGHRDIRTTLRYAHLEEQSVTRKARNLVDGWER